MENLDETKPYDTVYGSDSSIRHSYEQFGKFFNARKVRIDPKTGIVWDEDSVSELGLKEPVSSEPKVMGAHKDLPFKPNLGFIVGKASPAPRVISIDVSDSIDSSDEGIVQTDETSHYEPLDKANEESVSGIIKAIKVGLEEEKAEAPKARRTMSLKKAK